MSRSNKFDVWEFFIGRARQREELVVHPSILLIRKKNIELVFEDIFNNWFEIYERLHTVIDLFLGVNYNKKQYLTSDLLNLTQALEAYHRCLDEDKYLPESDYKKVYNVLAQNIPRDLNSELRASLKSRLKYGNELSLRSRLKKILKNLSEDYLELLKISSSDFIHYVVETRNYYTHYDPSSNSNIARGLELVEMNKKLSALIMVVLYKELQINDDAIIEAIEKFLNPPMFYDPNSDD